MANGKKVTGIKLERKTKRKKKVKKVKDDVHTCITLRAANKSCSKITKRDFEVCLFCCYWEALPRELRKSH